MGQLLLTDSRSFQELLGICECSNYPWQWLNWSLEMDSFGARGHQWTVQRELCWMILQQYQVRWCHWETRQGELSIYFHCILEYSHRRDCKISIPSTPNKKGLSYCPSASNCPSITTISSPSVCWAFINKNELIVGIPWGNLCYVFCPFHYTALNSIFCQLHWDILA